MVQINEPNKEFFDSIGVTPFSQRFPWIGGDLQTLRDTFISEKLSLENGVLIKIEVPSKLNENKGKGYLLASLNLPSEFTKLRGLVLMIHGLGGSSERNGLRRMASLLVKSGFSVLRLNLRGAGQGRKLLEGTYSAKCNSDLVPVISFSQKICDCFSNLFLGNREPLPLYGVGISLGGTILLNSCLELSKTGSTVVNPFKRLVCTSSPLDLASCSASIERPRNRIYQRWLLNRLVKQTIDDPFGINDLEREALIHTQRNSIYKIKSIRGFDSVITAPRWGYKNVDDYYKEASPINTIFESPHLLPPTLFLQSMDDPWVPSRAAENLKVKTSKKIYSHLKVVLTSNGGHNGFHGKKGCWGDQLVNRWLLKSEF